MDTPELHDLLEKLHAELQRTQSVDEPERERLRRLMADIQDVLGRSGEDLSPRYQSLSQQLAEALKHFEISHPILTQAIGQVLDILSRAGI